MVTRNEWYARVNSEWPQDVPALSGDEAIRATRKIYRFVIGRKLELPIKLTSGKRYTWPRDGFLYVNPESSHHDGGWKALVHDLSHWLFRKTHLGGKPHDKAHARLELRIVREVKRRGWISGSLKLPEKLKAIPAAEFDARELGRVLIRIQAWEAKRKRAERAIVKWKKKQRYYERKAA